MSKARQLADLGNVYDDGALSNRNLIINGAMQVAQRGTSLASGGFLLDRWFGNGVDAQSQSSDAPTGFTNSFEFTINTAGFFPNARHRIERANSAHVAGGQITISFWAKSISGTSNLFVEVYRAGSNDNFGSITLEQYVEVSSSPSTSWTYYTTTVSLSSSATTGLEIRIGRNNVSASSTRITGVQLEVGDTATPFEHRSYGDELVRCQRYFEKREYSGGYQHVCITVNVDTTLVRGDIYFNTEKRATPTLSGSSAGTWRVNAFGNDATASAISFNTTEVNALRIDATRGTGTHVAREASYINVENLSPHIAYWEADAEL